MDTYQQIALLERDALAAQAEGRHDEAIALHLQALAQSEQLSRPRLTAVVANRFGAALEAAGRIQSAVIAYESGLKALAKEPGSDLGAEINRLRGMAKGYEAGHAYLEVPDLYREQMARELADAEADPTLAVKTLINIGNAYLQQPQLDVALETYQRALAQPESAAAPALRAHALTHIGIIHRRQGETDRAEAALEQALALLDAQGAAQDRRRALGALAGIYRARGEGDRAVQTYQQALALYAQVDDRLGEGRTRAGLGHLHLLREEYDQARSAFERALELARGVRDEDTLWHAYWGLGCCRHVAGDLDGAADAFGRSLRKIEARHRELRTDEGKVTFLDSVQDIYARLIDVHVDRAWRDPSAYRDLLRVAEEARGQALHDLMGMRRRRLASRQAGTRPVRQRPFSERASSAADSVRQTAGGVDVPSPSVADMVRQAAPGVDVPSPSIADMVRQAAPGVDSARPDLPALLDDGLWQEDTAGLDMWIEDADAIPSAVPRWPERAPEAQEPSGIAGSAQPDAPPVPLARLVYHVLAARTAVIAVTVDGELSGHIAPVGREALAQRVAALRHALQVERPRGMDVTREAGWTVLPEAEAAPAPDHVSLLRALYADLVAPVADALPVDGTPVAIEPHGPLWLLPFAALQDPDGGWMADRWPLLYTPSAQVLDEIRDEEDYGSPADLAPLIVGNPTMPVLPERRGLAIALQPLPGAEQEARAVHALFDRARGMLLTGDAADWATVVASMPQHGIVHLATHGIADAEDPLASTIALAVPDEGDMEALRQRADAGAGGWIQYKFLHDLAPAEGQRGLLTARQVLYMPLPADLVVLSACQTGLGQIAGDGMIGLSRSFLVAGARSVLVSQWSVSDAATAALMEAFYRRYIELDDKAIALQGAMRAVRADPRYAHPRYWAPFVLVGAET